MMVTSTTVGFGDLSPVSIAGKAFTFVYALLGTTLIIRHVLPWVEAVLVPIRSALESKIELNVDTRNAELSLAEVNRQISYPKRYLRACIGPILLFAIGTVYATFGLKLKVIDSAYWSMITMTTIGFGDITPSTQADKLFAIVYLPLVVTAFADALAEIAGIRVRAAIRDTSGLHESAKDILLEDCKGDPDHKITESEFLINVLVQNGVVDELTCIAVRRKFAAMVHGEEAKIETDESKKTQTVLDAHAVYTALKRRGELDSGITYDVWHKSSWKEMVSAASTLSQMPAPTPAPSSHS